MIFQPMTLFNFFALRYLNFPPNQMPQFAHEHVPIIFIIALSCSTSSPLRMLKIKKKCTSESSSTSQQKWKKKRGLFLLFLRTEHFSHTLHHIAEEVAHAEFTRVAN